MWGTANPCGEENETYKGLYLRHRDIDSFIQEMPGKPVKVEHTGPPVGQVVHAWRNQSNGLDCILEINRQAICPQRAPHTPHPVLRGCPPRTRRDDSLDGSVIASLIDARCAKDLSLGYRVRMDMSSNGAHLEKEVVEVSIVKRGLRPHCHIHAFSSSPTPSTHRG